VYWISVENGDKSATKIPNAVVDERQEIARKIMDKTGILKKN
jgi:hypothetical protein